MRWIVGDVHGCIRPFERLLAAIRFDPARDALWCTGDLVNGGPESAEVLRLLGSVGGTSVLGNHEIYTIGAAEGWRNRRVDTLDPLLAAPDASELLASVRGFPLHAVLPRDEGLPDVLLVHAGLDPRWGDARTVLAGIEEAPRDRSWFASDPVRCATTVRCCAPDGERARHTGPPEDCPRGFRPWDALYRGSELVVHGHWARRGMHRGPRVLGLDSGCVYGGPLTAWCVEENRVVQVRGPVS